MTDADAVTFLVSSAGRRGELVRILQEVVAEHGHGGAVLTADMSNLAPAAYLGDGHLLVPRCTDPSFVDAVLAHCAAHGVTDVVPTIDTELSVYARAVDRFAAVGVRVWVSSPEATEIAADKRRTHAWLASHGHPVPLQWDLGRLGEIPVDAFPLIAKPARGSSSVGLRLLGSPDEAHGLDPSLDYVLETRAPGREHTVDVLVGGDGLARAAVVRRRLETRGGEVSKGVTVDDAALARLAGEVVESLPGARGVLNVQIFQDEPGEPGQVIEINARFGGGFPLTWASGCRMPLWLVQENANEVPSAPLTSRSGTLMLRYDSSVFLDDPTVSS